jgi:hypothetical protein
MLLRGPPPDGGIRLMSLRHALWLASYAVVAAVLAVAFVLMAGPAR